MRVDKMTEQQKEAYGFVKLTLDELSLIGLRKNSINGLWYYREKKSGNAWKGVAPDGYRRSSVQSPSREAHGGM